jgi:hypothetical protein
MAGLIEYLSRIEYGDSTHVYIIKHLRFVPDLETELMVGVTGRQGMLTSTGHLIPPLVYPGVHVYPDPPSGISRGPCLP